MKIIDVSAYQGIIDWTKVNKSNVGAAIIRAGYGSGHVDKRAAENINGALMAGLPVGLYWFSYATSAARAKAEADSCLEVASGWDIALPIYFDFEGDSERFAKSEGVPVNRAFVTGVTRAFCDRIAAAGLRAGYYFNWDYSQRLYDHSQLTAYSRWFAYWSNHIKSGVTCDIWQYSSTGRVAGINGAVDCDLLFNESLISRASQMAQIDELVLEVIDGKWGNGKARKQALSASGYDYKAVQEAVNTYYDLAAQVIDGQWGNGQDRKDRLTRAGYNYTIIQHLVNMLMK